MKLSIDQYHVQDPSLLEASRQAAAGGSTTNARSTFRDMMHESIRVQGDAYKKRRVEAQPCQTLNSNEEQSKTQAAQGPWNGSDPMSLNACGVAVNRIRRGELQAISNLLNIGKQKVSSRTTQANDVPT